MWRWFKRLISLPWLLAGTAIIGMAAGSWLTVQQYQRSEIRALEATIKDVRELRRADIQTLKNHHADQLAIERASAQVQSTLRDLPDRPECDLPESVSVLLDAHRQGETARGSVEGAGSATEAEHVSQGQAIAGHFDLADRFTLCRKQLIRLNEWYEMHGSFD